MPVIDVNATGKNIKNMMVKNNMTVKDLQRVFGFSTGQAIYKWISGKSLPSIDNMVVIAAVFDVKIDDIIAIQ